MMKRKSEEERLTHKRSLLIARTAKALSISEVEAATVLGSALSPSIRINSLIGDPEHIKEKLAAASVLLSPVEWVPHCYLVISGIETIKQSTLTSEGSVYIQNASSWLPVVALNPREGEQILDLCAAPGGKAAHIAELTNNAAELWVNDNSRTRLHKMRHNFERLNVKVTNTTMYDATYLASKFTGVQFDKILIDAPCSGEGMLTLDKGKELMQWSVKRIKRLSSQQKKLIRQAWALLKPGGTLVYSTCTIAPEENEAVVSYLLNHNPTARVVPINIPIEKADSVVSWNGSAYNSQVKLSLRAMPNQQYEAFFVCVIQKDIS